ncbi:B12-binding domain-containing radical SAM protein [Patescibacteria group bacterium]|nr:B12-binding domain-containing radical SAM protein [Patescibacteria group bacterium]
MKKVLLINPPFNIAKANYDSSISVGLLSIAIYLDSKNIPVKIIDGARQKNYLDLIKQEAPHCAWAGLSVMTTQIPGALQISQLIKEINPDCEIIWGGTHPTFFPEQTISNSLIDIVNFGEGEEVLHEIASGQELSQVKGIAYKRGGKIKINQRHELHDPAKMPLFNWDLIEREVLENLSLIPSLTSRGCPHRCTFCINAILKNKWRPRTVEQVLSDLTIIKSKPYFAGKKLRFWDENFFVDIERAKAINEGMISRNLIIPWETTVRANYLRQGLIDDNFLAKMKQSGCYLLSFGAESGSQRILEKIQKDISPEEIIESARMCLRHDIIPQYSFMIGLPGETRQDMMMTLRLIDQLVKLSDKVQILGPQTFRPYPGSVLYDECLQAGLPDEASAKAGWQAPQSLEEWSHLVQNELNYLAVKNFPWVADKDFVESMEAYVRFGAHSIKSAMGSSVKAQKLLKLGFVLLCQARWKLKFFAWPIEFKLAKKYAANADISKIN